MKTETKSDDTESIDSKELSWSADIERICYNLLDNIKTLQKTHKQNYLKLKSFLIIFRLPLIIISSANSVFSVGLTLFINQQTTSVITCLLALVCAIISAIELFLQIQKGLESELASFHQLKLLGIRIAHQLKLDPSNRENAGNLFLNSVMADYTNIFEASIVSNNDLEDKLFNFDEINTTKNKLLLESPRRIVIRGSDNNLNSEL